MIAAEKRIATYDDEERNSVTLRTVQFIKHHWSKRYATAFWISILAVFAGVFLIQGRGELIHAGQILGEAHPGWIILIIALQCLNLMLTGLTYRIVLRFLGHGLELSRLTYLHLQRKVVGTITPAGGPASVYVFVRSLDQHGVPSDDALFTTGLRSFVGYASFVSLLIPVTVLARPSGLVLAGAGVVVAIFIFTLLAIRLLLRGQGPWQHLEPRLPLRLIQSLQRSRSHNVRLADLGAPYLLALTSHLTNVATLGIALLAVGQYPSLTTILVSYTIGTVLITLTPVFQGIGVVEVTMALTLQQFGISPGAAVGATLLYRVATVWLPLVVGSLLHLGHQIARHKWLSGWLDRPVTHSNLGSLRILGSDISTNLRRRGVFIVATLLGLTFTACATAVGFWLDRADPLFLGGVIIRAVI